MAAALLQEIRPVQGLAFFAAEALAGKRHRRAVQRHHPAGRDQPDAPHRKPRQQRRLLGGGAGDQPQRQPIRRLGGRVTAKPGVQKFPQRLRQAGLGVRVADQQNRQAGDGVFQMAAGVQRRPQADLGAAQLQLHADGFGRRFGPSPARQPPPASTSSTSGETRR